MKDDYKRYLIAYRHKDGRVEFLNQWVIKGQYWTLSEDMDDRLEAHIFENTLHKQLSDAYLEWAETGVFDQKEQKWIFIRRTQS